MNALQDIIKLLDYNDNKAFISYLRKKNKRNDTGNIELFKLLETDDINAFTILYPDAKNNDAYHALRKRLHDSLIDFMANRTFENTTGEAHEALRLLVVSRFFLEHKLTKTAFKCLAKAESRALPLEEFSLLNEIYHTQIQFAHLNPAYDLDAVIAKFAANKELLHREGQLNIGYALLRRELAAIQLKGKVIDFRAFIIETMNRLGVSLNEVLTYKSLYQILFIANEYATLNHNFTLVVPFVQKSYDFLAEKSGASKSQLYYPIYIVYFMANINFRNHKFAESEAYLEQMMEQMQQHNSRYYQRFYLRHQLLLSLNKNFSGSPSLAISIADKALKNAPKNADVQDVNDLRACLAMFYVQQHDRTAFKHMAQFSHTDSWYEKHLGMLWTIRKNLLEILMYADFDNDELALSRLKSFKRRYKKYLLQVNEQRVMDFALLTERYILKPEIATVPAFKDGVLAMVSAADKEDIFVLSFLGWLLGKAEKRITYEATLSLFN